MTDEPTPTPDDPTPVTDTAAPVATAVPVVDIPTETTVTNDPETDTPPADPVAGLQRFLLVVPVGSVVTKPDYVDVVELRENDVPTSVQVHPYWTSG